MITKADQTSSAGASALCRILCLCVLMLTCVIQVNAQKTVPIRGTVVSADDGDIMVDYIGIVERQSTDIFMTANKHILTVLAYIHQHYADRLTVERLLKLVPMSRRLLEKTFKAETGTSIYQYIMNLRFERMKQQLVSTDTPIADLALATGLSDAKNVARIFNQREGVTPIEYRHQHGGCQKK